MPTVNSPIQLTAYPSSTDGTWVFPWALVFDPVVHDPSTLRYELMVDTFPTFASPNVKHVFSNGADIVNFQNGELGKAIELQLPKRQPDTDVRWYWKMRINGYGYAGGYVSNWSDTGVLIIPSDQTLAQSSAMFDGIADEYSYSKESKSSDLYKVLNMIGLELDKLLLESNYTQTDTSLDGVRDTAVKSNFGSLVNLDPTAEPGVSYRWKVRELFKSFLNSVGVVSGIQRAVKAFVGEDPSVYDSTSRIGWILPINYIKHPSHAEVKPTIVLYSRLEKGYYWTLNVWNSWNLSYDQTTLESYVNKIKPAHTKVNFVYETQKHAQIKFDTAEDWNSGALTGLQTIGNSLQIIPDSLPINFDITVAPSSFWASQYNADSLLSATTPPWTLTNSFVTDNASGGVLTLETNSPGTEFYTLNETFSNTDGVTVYLRLKVLGGVSSSAFTVDVCNGTRRTSLGFTTTGIAVGANGSWPTSYSFDTTDDFHDYVYSVINSKVYLYVDGVLVIEWTSGSSTTDNYLRLGNSAGTYSGANGKVEIEKIYYTRTVMNGGTFVSPVINVPNLNTWGALTMDQTLSGQQISEKLRTSTSGIVGTFSNYEEINNGETPSTSPLYEFIQLQVDLTSYNASVTPILNSLKLNVLHS